MIKQTLLSITLTLCLLATGCTGNLPSPPSITEPSTAEDGASSVVYAEASQQTRELRSIKEDIQDFYAVYKALGRGDDTFYTPEEVAILTSFMAEQGYTVINDRERRLYNQQAMLDFLELAAAGRNGEALLCQVSRYGITSVEHFRSADGGITLETNSFVGEAHSVHTYSLDSLFIDEWGHLRGYVDNHQAMTTYRLVPQPQEYVDAYLAYVLPLSDYVGAQTLYSEWKVPSQTEPLLWETLFLSLLHTVGENRSPEPDDNDPEYCVFDAGFYEGLLQQYFDVPTETLRNQELSYGRLYDAQTGTYRLKGYRGLVRDVVLEVWDVTHNADGSLTLEVHDTYASGNFCLLTVMPGGDGTFRYISNQLIFE